MIKQLLGRWIGREAPGPRLDAEHCRISGASGVLAVDNRSMLTEIACRTLVTGGLVLCAGNGHDDNLENPGYKMQVEEFVRGLLPKPREEGGL